MGAEHRDREAVDETPSCRRRWIERAARAVSSRNVVARQCVVVAVLAALMVQALVGCGGGSSGGSSGPTGPSRDGAAFEIVSEQIVRDGPMCPLRISVRNLTSDLIVFTAIYDAFDSAGNRLASTSAGGGFSSISWGIAGGRSVTSDVVWITGRGNVTCRTFHSFARRSASTRRAG
jgi:hypothetical protein